MKKFIEIFIILTIFSLFTTTNILAEETEETEDKSTCMLTVNARTTEEIFNSNSTLYVCLQNVETNEKILTYVQSENNYSQSNTIISGTYTIEKCGVLNSKAEYPYTSNPEYIVAKPNGSCVIEITVGDSSSLVDIDDSGNINNPTAEPTIKPTKVPELNFNNVEINDNNLSKKENKKVKEETGLSLFFKNNFFNFSTILLCIIIIFIYDRRRKQKETSKD